MNPAVRYRITPTDPQAHLFEVVCTVPAPAAGGQVFRLPSWIRGSYLVRDFAKHVQDLSAECEGRAVAIERLDKRSLRCAPCDGPLLLRYRVYARDESVRKAWLDSRRGFFNGSSLCYRVEAHDGPYELELLRGPCEDWRAASAMPALETDAEGWGLYRCEDYEALIDHPFELGCFETVDFTADGVPHRFVLAGRYTVDRERLARDAAKICETERALFGGEPALDQYLFLTNAVGNGYGGLEHRASSALICSRDSLPAPGEPGVSKHYRQFLGLVSHEYFHLWNVKRITAQAFAESDLGAEAYTRDLWHYEGVTSYYDDLFLLRAGLIDAPTYLDVLAENATRLARTPGRLRHSLADASFEAWTKYYQPDENTPNATVSYYIKGAFAALCLDLHLRRHSRITLDDVMRALWQRFGATGAGVPEGGLEALAQELSGLDLQAQFDAWLRGTDELPLAESLAAFGVQATPRAAHADNDAGGRSNGAPMPAWVGAKLKPGGTQIGYVLADSPAQRAGLSAGDELLALDGLKLGYNGWLQAQAAMHPAREYALHYFRGDELMQTRLIPSAPPLDTWTFTLADADADTLARRKAWLGA